MSARTKSESTPDAGYMTAGFSHMPYLLINPLYSRGSPYMNGYAFLFAVRCLAPGSLLVEARYAISATDAKKKGAP